MGFFGRLFGSGTTVEKIQKAYSSQNWAEVVALAEELGDTLRDSGDTLVEQVAAAGNRLAEINLEQAEACLRADDPQRAREHLELAEKHGRDSELCQKARRLLAECDAEPDLHSPVVAQCGGCGTDHAKQTETLGSAQLNDFAEAWELTLAALPAPWSGRYAHLPQPLQQAVLYAHAGQDEEAKQLFLAHEQPELAAVTHYELAGLYLRNRELEPGLALLESLLRDYPDHDLALVLAIDLVRQRVTLPWLHEHLESNLAQGIQVGLCHAGLAKLAAVSGHEDDLVRQTIAALDCGYLDYELLTWSAGILEKRGQVDAAEQMLQQLPGGGGCSGGSDPLLGEFWLRQGRKLDQALNSFKSAARQDPESPRWALRIAQTYLAKGWKREAAAMLTQILRTPQLDEELKKEAEFAMGKAAG